MFKRIGRETLAVLLALCMTVSMIAPALATEGGHPEVSTHWAGAEMNDWAEKGWLRGDEGGNLNPDATVTRAQFMAFVNRMMGYTERSAAIDEYGDVPQGAWFYEDAAVALAAGYMQGAEGRMRPEDTLTRNEAVIILARLAELETGTADEAVLGNISDGAEVPDWARAALASAVAEGLMAGSGGAFRGTGNVTRAETVVMLGRIDNGNRVFGFPGTYSGEVSGDVTVASGGVVLKDMKISGSLTISSAVGGGRVELNGAFGNVISHAAGVTLHMTGSVALLALNAPAAITGGAVIARAEIAAEAGKGTSFATAPKELTGEGKDDVTLPAAGGGGGGGGNPGGNSGGTDPGTQPATTVILAPGSKGVAGDGKITGLKVGAYYKVEVGTGTSKQVKYCSGYGLHSEFIFASPLYTTEVYGLQNGETYMVIEATPINLTGARVYEYTSESSAQDISGKATFTSGTVTIFEDDISRMPVSIFAVYANLNSVLGTPSPTNPLKIQRAYAPTADWTVTSTFAYAVKLDEVHAATPPYDTNKWIPYTNVGELGTLPGGSSVTRAELNAVMSDERLIFNYGTNTAIINPALAGLTEMNIAVTGQELDYVFETGAQFCVLRVRVTPNALTQVKKEKLDELRSVAWENLSEYWLDVYTPESYQVFVDALEADKDAIAALTTIAEVENYTFTFGPAKDALELKTDADDRLVKIAAHNAAFLNAAYATKADAEAAIKAAAVYGTLADAEIVWAGTVAAVTLNSGTAAFAFSDIAEATTAEPSDDYAFVVGFSWAGIGSSSIPSGYANVALLFPDGSTEQARVFAFYDNTGTQYIPTSENWLSLCAEYAFDQFVGYSAVQEGGYVLYQLADDKRIPRIELQAYGDKVFHTGAPLFGSTPVNDETVFLFEVSTSSGLEYLAYTGTANTPSVRLRGPHYVAGGLKQGGVATFVFAQADLNAWRADYVYFANLNCSSNMLGNYHYINAYFNGYFSGIVPFSAQQTAIEAGGLYKITARNGSVITALERVGGAPVNYLATTKKILTVGGNVMMLSSGEDFEFDADTRVFVQEADLSLRPGDESDIIVGYYACAVNVVDGYIHELYLIPAP